MLEENLQSREQPLEYQRRKLSRDEMNLAEFPLTVLSTRVDQSVKTLEFNDTIRGRNGEQIQRSWIITGADKFGLPTSSDDEVLLGLLKLTVEREFQSPRVEFTRYELLRALRWTTEGRSYERLQRALDRLSGVRIKASNAFFDNESKSHSTRNFGIIDEYEINDGRENPKPSFFVWSDVLFKSFQVGFIKKLDLEFFLDLRSAVSKRLYRYLDKHFWYKNSWQINLFTLAHEKIGISRNYRHASSLKQQLDPAIEELTELGFIKSAQYSGKGRETEITFVSGRGPGKQQIQGKVVPLALNPAIAAAPSRGGGPREQSRAQQSLMVERRSEVAPTESDGTLSYREHLVELLAERGIKQAQAERLLAPHGDDGLQRIGKIIEHFDQVRSRQVLKSPVGFLYRAVEKPYVFSLPEDPRSARPRQTAIPLHDRATSHQSPSAALPHHGLSAHHGSSGLPRRDDKMSEWLVARHETLERLKQNTDPNKVLELRKQVEVALVKIRGCVSEKVYQQTVEQGVSDRLLKLSGFPCFEDWSGRQ